MSGHKEGDGEVFQMTVISPELVKQEDNQAPLLVAMQPGVEVKIHGNVEGVHDHWARIFKLSSWMSCNKTESMKSETQQLSRYISLYFVQYSY